MTEQTKLNKNDFIEIEFTGKTSDGDVFDSNIKTDLEKIPNSDPKQAKSLIFALGQDMFLKGVDDFLIGKEFGKTYEINLNPEQAFGTRNSKLIQLMPLKLFQEHKLNPFPGAVFNFDRRIGKVLSVSGGRIMVDFNHPLAGKRVSYNINVLRKVNDTNEKINAFIDFLFRMPLKFSLDEKNKKLTIEAEKEMKSFIELFKNKFKEIFDLDLEVIENKPEKLKGKKSQQSL